MSRRTLIAVYLDADEYRRLDELAYAESRIPEQQASHMLRRAIAGAARRPTERVTTAARVERRPNDAA